MEKNLVSIVVPVYNAELLIERCIESVLSQSYKKFELLLIDDGSVDNSGVLCDNYVSRDCRVRTFHKKNGGVSSARNLGISYASGEYLTFLDADDYYETNFLENCLKNNNSDLVISGFRRIGKINNLAQCEIAKHYFINKGLGEDWSNAPENFLFWFPWGKIFRSDVIKKNNIRFDENLFYSEDFCFVMDYLINVNTLDIITHVDYVHYIEPTNRSVKYKMNANHLIVHYMAHELRFSKLGEKCNQSFRNIKIRVYRRLFKNFLGYLSLSSVNDFYEQARFFNSWSSKISFFDMVFDNVCFLKKMVYQVMIKFPLFLRIWLKSNDKFQI